MSASGTDFSEGGGYTPAGVSVERPNARSSLLYALRIQMRVIGALTLRDLRTRFGGSYLSYSIAILWPLSHLAILLVVYSAIGRTPSYGTDLFAWVMSGVLPFILFAYTTRQTSIALISNASLLSFSIVRRIDLLVARAIVELVTSVSVTTVIFSIFLLLRGEFAFAHFETCLLAALASYGTGLCLGVFGAPIVRLFPMAVMIIYMFCILCWITAGIVYLPDSVPEPLHSWFALNPLVHCSEFFRTGLYHDYQSRTLDLDYLFTLDAVILLTGLSLERALPKLATWVKYGG
jgi:capsular polysaccharide transport system permease protein